MVERALYARFAKGMLALGSDWLVEELGTYFAVELVVERIRLYEGNPGPCLSLSGCFCAEMCYQVVVVVNECYELCESDIVICEDWELVWTVFWTSLERVGRADGMATAKRDWKTQRAVAVKAGKEHCQILDGPSLGHGPVQLTKRSGAASRE